MLQANITQNAINRYRYNRCGYGPVSFDYGVFAKVMSSHPAGVRFITGKPEIVSQLSKLPERYRVKRMNNQHLCSLHQLLKPEHPMVPSRRATILDINPLMKVYKGDDVPRSRAQIEMRFKDVSGWRNVMARSFRQP